MKKITLLIILITTLGFSQQETFEVTFESGTPEADVSIWNTFENDTNPGLEIVSNPDATGMNTSSTVAKFTALDTGNPWAGTETNHVALGEWFLETGNNTLSIMVYKTVISDVGVKFVNATNGTVFELKQENTVINTWETLSYDISSFIGSGENHNIDRFVIFPDWPTDRASDNIVYFDSITWTANRTKDAGVVNTSDQEPTDAPTAPTLSTSSVISLFSDAYTDLAATWNPGWGQSTVLEDKTIANNAVKKYSSFTFTGIEPTGGTVDAALMTHINLDYWTSDATELKVKLVDYNGDGTWGSDNTEVEVIKTVTTGAWGTLSIPFTDFTAINSAINFNDIGQLVLSATGATNSVYIDNFYFSNASVLSTKGFTLTKVSLHPNPSTDFVTISADKNIEEITIYNVLGKTVKNISIDERSKTIDVSQFNSGFYLIKYVVNNSIGTAKFIKE